jgi:hypothetical protein
MTKIYLVIVMSLICLGSMAQTINYKFRIRYNDYSPLANSNFVISGHSLATDPQGIINMEVSSTISYVNIGSSDVKLYEIKYPLEGKAVLPKDPGVFVDIFVAKPAADPLNVISAQVAKSQAAFQSAIFQKLDEQSKRGYDEIVEVLKKKNLDDSTLVNGRLEFFPLISSALNNYLNEARNFNDSFMILSTSLDTKGAYDALNQHIYSYNEIFNLLNANKSAYEQAIATYWNSKELSLKFSNLIDFAIEDFHKPYILEVNYTFIPRIYQTNAESNKRKKEKMQKDLSADMNSLSDAMTRRLNALGEQITSMNTLLNNNKRVDN